MNTPLHAATICLSLWSCKNAPPTTRAQGSRLLASIDWPNCIPLIVKLEKNLKSVSVQKLLEVPCPHLSQMTISLGSSEVSSWHMEHTMSSSSSSSSSSSPKTDKRSKHFQLSDEKGVNFSHRRLAENKAFNCCRPLCTYSTAVEQPDLELVENKIIINIHWNGGHFLKCSILMPPQTTPSY